MILLVVLTRVKLAGTSESIELTKKCPILGIMFCKLKGALPDV